MSSILLVGLLTLDGGGGPNVGKSVCIFLSYTAFRNREKRGMMIMYRKGTY